MNLQQFKIQMTLSRGALKVLIFFNSKGAMNKRIQSISTFSDPSSVL
jgi:hypothetical protein